MSAIPSTKPRYSSATPKHGKMQRRFLCRRTYHFLSPRRNRELELEANEERVRDDEHSQLELYQLVMP